MVHQSGIMVRMSFMHTKPQSRQPDDTGFVAFEKDEVFVRSVCVHSEVKVMPRGSR